MLYILEGPRNSGKTTAVRKIKEALGESAYIIKFQRTSRPAPPVFMTEFLTKNYLALIDSRSICILDRFHLTEFVMRSLDGKVDHNILVTTTNMIDVMLKHCGAVTYILQTPQEVRHDRLKLRDPGHQKREWPSYKELDSAWEMATKLFRQSKVKVWSGNTSLDIDKLVVDVVGHKGGGKTLREQIPLLSPIIQIEEVLQPA